VPMMNQGGMVRYAETDHSLAVSIPYVGEQVSMVAFMPLSEEDDFEAWEDALTHGEFDALAQNLSHTEGQFHLPRFESESATELKDVLKAMGMLEAFERREADFEGITGVGPGIDFKSLYISDIFHKTFVSVDEEGTEAAAATAVVMATPTSMPLDPIDVRFDRPFYYAIYDHPTETVLFLGRMVDPS
jgi:serpin B